MASRIDQKARGAAASKLARDSLIVCESSEMAVVLGQVEEAAANDTPVLIEGEPGSGRELVARTIHYAGPRRDADFVAMKCTAIPKGVLSGELFGERSITLRRANGGTLLVKDVDALPAPHQRGLARILRRRRGDEDSGRDIVDVRLIGAADGDVHEAVAASSFDRELYDRLIARIRIPPLRRRIADLPKLVRHFLAHANKELGRSTRFTEGALERLSEYPWPGNVAELKDVVRRLVLATKGRSRRDPIDGAAVDAVLPKVAQRVPVEDMSFEELVRTKLKGFLRRVEGYPVHNLYDDVIARVERPLLSLVMEHAQGSQLRAAEILGLNRNTLRKKLTQHELSAREGSRKT